MTTWVSGVKPMRVLIVGDDHDTVTEQIRTILSQQRTDCPEVSVVSLEIAPSRAEMLRPELILFLFGTSLKAKDMEIVRALREVTTGTIACIGPTDDGRLIIRLLREGLAHHYLDIANLESELQELLKLFEPKTENPLSQGKLLALLGVSGGCGTSTLAVNLAAFYSRSSKKCALLDFDIESGILASLLDLTPTQHLDDFCSSLNRVDRSLFENMFTVHESGIHLLASPRLYNEPLTINAEGLHQAILLSRSIFPHVVVDLNLDRSFRETENTILRLADRILIVFRMEIASLRNCRKRIDHLQRLDISSDRIELIANRFGQPHDVPADMAETVLGIKITHAIPNDASTINRANNKGVPLVTTSSWSSVSRSLIALARNGDF